MFQDELRDLTRKALEAGVKVRKVVEARQQIQSITIQRVESRDVLNSSYQVGTQNTHIEYNINAIVVIKNNVIEDIWINTLDLTPDTVINSIAAHLVDMWQEKIDEAARISELQSGINSALNPTPETTIQEKVCTHRSCVNYFTSACPVHCVWHSIR